MSFRDLVLLSFVLNGLGMIGMKLVPEMGLTRATPLVMSAMYGLAAVFALVHLMMHKPKMQRKSLVIGLVAGVSSATGIATSIRATAMLPGYVVFPVCSCGTIFLVAVAGRFALGERIGPYGLAGIALGIAAIAFLAG